MILEEIVLRTKERLEKEKEVISLATMIELSKDVSLVPFAFEKKISGPGMHVICEVKKASPSKGILVTEFPYKEIAMDYERAGADAISVLTEPYFFKGSNLYLKEIKEVVSIPVLRKDFTIDEYQIYQAKALGADCILLICAILTEEQLYRYMDLCNKLLLSAIVEVHSEEETRIALKAGASMIGVNNRNLKDFSVDIRNSLRLRELIPKDVIMIAESGIQSASQLYELKQADINAVLIGETLMRAENKKKALQQLKGECG